MTLTCHCEEGALPDEAIYTLVIQGIVSPQSLLAMTVDMAANTNESIDPPPISIPDEIKQTLRVEENP
jgi:hypothetical protein